MQSSQIPNPVSSNGSSSTASIARSGPISPRKKRRPQTPTTSEMNLENSRNTSHRSLDPETKRHQADLGGTLTLLDLALNLSGGQTGAAPALLPSAGASGCSC